MVVSVLRPPRTPLLGHLPPFLSDRPGFLLACAGEARGRPVELRVGTTVLLLTDAADVEQRSA